MDRHVTVLKNEAIEGLNIRPDAIVVDATLGNGGHAREILNILKENGTFVGIDADGRAVAAARQALEGRARIHLAEANFRELPAVLDGFCIRMVDAVLADLGWRMEQFAGGERGFSFKDDEPLIMTYGDPKSYPFTARDIVNGWSEESLANVFYGYGEERFARRIAAAIVRERAKAPVETSGRLAAVVGEAVPAFYRRGKTHPATKTFQALRIAVNDELAALETFIAAAVGRLAPAGRLAIITFHSIEDRIVKKAFRSLESEGAGLRVTKRPQTPADEELEANPRARSAKLRIFQTASS
jgi:16S rRNA (cytosine1402-N4)-methyltransferase